MILNSIEFHENPGEPLEWQLNGLTLESINLLVGRNATGKTRTLGVIGTLSRLLSGEQQPKSLAANYSAVLTNGPQEYAYQLRIAGGKVDSEILSIDGKAVLKRGEGGYGTIFAEKLNGGTELEFQSPTDEIAAVSRRDSIQHPYLQPLNDWAKSVRHYHFGTALGKDHAVMHGDERLQDVDGRDADKVIRVFEKGRQDYGEGFVNELIQDLQSIDYPLEAIDTGEPVSFQLTDSSAPRFRFLRVKESGINGLTDQNAMSQGMFRVVSLLILVNYASRFATPTCVLVDDIGEGLDFSRSCRLIDLLREKAENSKMQLIMSTNDRFVMNQVPLQEWSVLERSGGIVTVKNYKNSRDQFEEFRFTGLSNFSLLETDFLNSPHAMATAQ